MNRIIICNKCKRITQAVRDEINPTNVLACIHPDCDNHLFSFGFKRIEPEKELTFAEWKILFDEKIKGRK